MIKLKPKLNRRIAMGVCAVAAALLGGQAFAADGTITVTGTIKATTCSVTFGLGAVQPLTAVTAAANTITLPTISFQSIQAVGAAAGTTVFSIGVTGCGTAPSTANTMAANFETTSPISATGGVITTTGTGVAGKFMRLLNSDQSTPVVPGTPLAATAVTNGNAFQTFAIQWFNGTGATLTSSTVGNASATLTYTINYT